MTTKRSKGSSAVDLEKEILGGSPTFGEAVEALRIRDGFSQVAFARKLRVSRQYLCDVEKGRRLVSPAQAVRFARAFGHRPDVFIQLSLQDAVRATGLRFRVDVVAA